METSMWQETETPDNNNVSEPSYEWVLQAR